VGLVSPIRNLEGVTSMFLGAWCGQMGVAGWILMGIFWVTFLGLVLWALSRLFAGPQRDDGVHEDLESPRYHLDLGLWVPTPTGSAASNPQQPQLRPLSSHRPGGGGRTRSRKGA